MQHYQRPQPPLSAFVDLFWSIESDAPACGLERRLPNGSMSLIITLRENGIRVYDRQRPDQCQTHPGSLISGAHSTFALIDRADQQALLGIEFKPGGALPFLGLSAADLHNQTISLEALWGTEAKRLREQLLAASAPARRFALLEQTLLARLASARMSHPAVSYALQQFHSAPRLPAIAAVTQQIALSQARFIQVFSEAVGLTPKQYCRVQRFQHVLQRLDRPTPIKWTELALACGYFDQAHFIHEFQALAGTTPSAYLARRGDHHNHIAHREETL